jgi:sulfite exporter TauE/SafE
VLSGLILTAFLMGLGGMPHCAAMCGVACAAALPKGVPALTFLGRALGYAMLGAVAATGAGLIAQWGRHVAFLQPLWIMALLACVFVGVWVGLSGRMPPWVDRMGARLHTTLKSRLPATPRSSFVGRAVWQLASGWVWAALPCGLLYAALMVAALSPTGWGGAVVMLAFAAPTGFGVWAAPRVWVWLMKRQRPAQVPSAGAVPVLWAHQGRSVQLPMANPQWAVRLGGVMLAAMAAWGAYHQVVAQWRAWCA